MGFFSSITHALHSIPVIGPAASAVAGLALAPLALTESIVRGERIDKAIVGSVKAQFADIKGIAPYVTTVLSVVPGVGTTVSGVLSAGLALAQGQKITDALVSGIKGAIPGGAIAESAFSAATAIAQGKRLDDVALAALPIPDETKKALGQALTVAQRIGKGENVANVALSTALEQLPADLRKATQIGMTMGHAISIQRKVTVKAADKVLSAYHSGSPQARAAAVASVKRVTLQARRGDATAKSLLSVMSRKEAGMRAASRFRVAKTGHVVRASINT